ncbi:tight adherence pilus pseudopilin TadF [Vibrio agarivorans]|uniref:Tight adherence pilus pseudopilin TadF n=1 Tax=Vibrio agarivorans TaxID=153622 RepID=A0ABT7Y6U8_9VIBR|nr:tight adherence pilus pseudopilin TadF [Vibrio agarivorans]
MISSISTKKGNFTVEFAIIGIALSLLFAFSGDVIIKLSYKGKLDRLSFSAANILKEKTQLYDTREFVSGPEPTFDEDVTDIIDIITSSLSRSVSNFNANNFSYSVESMTYDGVDFSGTLESSATGDCEMSKTLQEIDSGGEFSVISSWGRRTPLYRVSLCYDAGNWIGSLLGANYSRVSSSSIIIGR